MKIKVFDSVPPAVLDRLVEFESEYKGKNWGDFYKATIALGQHYPGFVLTAAPRLYTDLEKETYGYLFIDESEGKAYYVYQ